MKQVRGRVYSARCQGWLRGDYRSTWALSDRVPGGLLKDGVSAEGRADQPPPGQARPV